MENETIRFIKRKINLIKDQELQGAILDLIDQHKALIGTVKNATELISSHLNKIS